MELLRGRGAVVSYCDPHVPNVRLGNDTFQSLSLESVSSATPDLVAVLVGGPWPLDEFDRRGVLVFDAVNAGGSASVHRRRL
jgi:hypothetical protein